MNLSSPWCQSNVDGFNETFVQASTEIILWNFGAKFTPNRQA